ncbi:hypothetical protein HAPAU_39460 [Halalkalicoccus paucihalophilus]|uniref:Uncharacterized protein n=1 Tax=Halalkalicoccus paucihalophilus TaxID=1008153 RepID=A0A151A905_9EURY|nr:hypothetical protein [Halalkalicoccus paucihalophilus]KYH23867.1 hypothetical protein HAPAU_39460 [Halalkalicoccus paucihalophilus]
MESDDVDLDWRSIEILQALNEADDALETSAIRDATAVEDNRRILYRVSEYLEPDGLVTTTQPDRNGTTIPPKRIALTEAGSEVAQSIVNSRGNASNLEDLPSLVDQLQATVEMHSEKITALEEQVSHIDEQLTDRRETDAAVSTALTDLDERLATLEDEEEEEEENGN